MRGICPLWMPCNASHHVRGLASLRKTFDLPEISVSLERSSGTMIWWWDFLSKVGRLRPAMIYLEHLLTTVIMREPFGVVGWNESFEMNQENYKWLARWKQETAVRVGCDLLRFCIKAISQNSQLLNYGLRIRCLFRNFDKVQSHRKAIAWSSARAVSWFAHLMAANGPATSTKGIQLHSNDFLGWIHRHITGRILVGDAD